MFCTGVSLFGWCFTFQNASLLGLSLLRSRVRGACKNRLDAAWCIAALTLARAAWLLISARCLHTCPSVPHQRRRHCSSPAEPSGNRGGSPSRLFRRYLGPQPRSATGLQASPLRDGSTVTERAHHAGAVPLARLLTRLSVSAPSGSSVAATGGLRRGWPGSPCSCWSGARPTSSTA